MFFLSNYHLNDSDVYSVSILKLLEGLRRASQVLKYLSKNPSESWGLRLSVALKMADKHEYLCAK